MVRYGSCKFNAPAVECRLLHMEKVTLETKADNTLAFVLYDNQKKAGEMVVTIRGNELTAEHTEMEPFYQGRGFGAKLVDGMAEYVRSNGMIVTVLCPYSYSQFNRDPEKYNDIWNRHKRPPGIRLT